MKKTILLTTFSFICLSVFGQAKYKCYATFSDYLSNGASKEITLKKKSWERGPRKRKAGFDYQFVPFEKSIKRKEIKNNMCIISDKTGDYINGLKLNLTCWGKIIDKGRYLIFKGGKTASEKEGGAALGGIAGAVIASGRYLYAYDTVKKEVIRFNKKNARMLLASHPDLLKKYNDSKKINERSLDVFLEYLVELNDRS